MDSVLYLVHMTNSDPRKWAHKELMTTEYSESQFPGAFFSLITDFNIDVEQLGGNYESGTEYAMIFSTNLLYQNNYHLNLVDYNGIITERNTFFPWKISEGVEMLKYQQVHRNEIVFHDNVPFSFLVDIRVDGLPRMPAIPRGIPNTSRLPFYAYCFEDKYTGIDPLPKSSKSFFLRMARLARLSPVPHTIKDIVDEIKKKAPYLYSHRDQQNISALLE